MRISLYKDLAIIMLLVASFTLVGCSKAQKAEEKTNTEVAQESAAKETTKATDSTAELATSDQPLEKSSPKTQPEKTEQKKEEAKEEKTPAAELTEEEKKFLETNSPSIRNFSPALYQNIQGKKPVVLYFHASWCPTCKDLKKRIETDLSQLPENTKIMVVNFDESQQLKSDFGVVTQSTLVYLDQYNNKIATQINPSNEMLKKEMTKLFQ